MVVFGMMVDVLGLVFEVLGFCMGEDFFFVYFFEWEDLGNFEYEFVVCILKFVGGVDECLREFVVEFYCILVLEVVDVG